MFITFRDELGMNLVIIDEYGISFLDGEAFFSSSECEYRIPIKNICEIQIINTGANVL